MNCNIDDDLMNQGDAVSFNAINWICVTKILLVNLLLMNLMKFVIK